MSWFDNAQSLMDKTWLGSLLGIVSFIAAIIFYFWPRKQTRLSYVHLGEHVLGSASDTLPSAIVVQYNGISIPRLTKSILIFWNSGENTVKGEDIVAKDPLRVHVGDDGQILSAVILKSSRAVNDFSILKTPDIAANEITFDFSFLDKDDGAVVEILHTSTDRKPRIRGTLKGLPQGFRNLGQFTRPKPQKNKTGALLSTFTTSLFPALVFSSAAFLFAMYFPRPEIISAGTFNGLMGALGGFSSAWLGHAWTTRRRYPKSLHLEALE